MSKETRTLKKITLKDILGIERGADVKAIMLEHAAKETELAAIAGDVRGYGGKTTQFGESLFLVGDFVAQNRVTGEVFKSQRAYLPKDATEAVVARFNSRKGDDEYVNFTLIVKVIKDKSAMGFTYVCEPVRDARSVTREAELLATFAALPAPKEVKVIAKK